LRYLLGQHQEAEQDARDVIRTCPEFGDAWLLLGDALSAQGKDTEVESLLRTLGTGEGAWVLGALLRASRSARLGDRPEALAVIKQSAQAHAEHPFLQRAEGRLLAGTSFTAAHLLAAAAVP
jgi:hypothetical protein